MQLKKANKKKPTQGFFYPETCCVTPSALSLGQTMGIPSLGPLWLSASPATEAVLSAWDVAVLQGQKISLQSVSWQDEVGSEGAV